MKNEGKWPILVMLCLAVALSAFGWYWNQQAVRRCLAFWGAAAGREIAAAPHAELLELVKGGTPAALPPDDLLDVNGSTYLIAQRADVSEARGFGNVRHMLVQDASFDWSATTPAERTDWSYAFKFSGGQGSVVVLLAPQAQQAALAGQQGIVQFHPAAAKILLEFIGEQFQQ